MQASDWGDGEGDAEDDGLQPVTRCSAVNISLSGKPPPAAASAVRIACVPASSTGWAVQGAGVGEGDDGGWADNSGSGYGAGSGSGPATASYGDGTCTAAWGRGAGAAGVAVGTATGGSPAAGNGASGAVDSAELTTPWMPPSPVASRPARVNVMMAL
jgi:hypothetical protein